MYEPVEANYCYYQVLGTEYNYVYSMFLWEKCGKFIYTSIITNSRYVFHCDAWMTTTSQIPIPIFYRTN